MKPARRQSFVRGLFGTHALASLRWILLVLGAVGIVMPAGPAHANNALACTLTFNLSGWSAFYRTAAGRGTIRCDDGQQARVKITSKGGGITFGKANIVNGKGTFSSVSGINELFGSYAVSEAHAGVVKSGDAQVLTKGTVSLALAGTGRGVDIGFMFGRLTITRIK